MGRAECPFALSETVYAAFNVAFGEKSGRNVLHCKCPLLVP